MDKTNQNKTWFEKLFSLDEFKVSGLIVALMVFLGLDIVSFLRTGDLANNLLMANAYVIGGISGVSLVGMAMNTYSNNNSNQYGNNQYSQYGNSQYQQPLNSQSISSNPNNQITINNQMENESDPASRGI